jgi:PIN domain nuclease of toxin-antitoxin system
VNLLLDTNALLWWLADSERLGQHARTLIADPQRVVYVNAASAWEIAIKVGLGRLAVPADSGVWLPAQLLANRFTPLAIELRHALAVERLPRHHNDPFDRLLVAQAITEQLTIVTGDSQLERYAAPVIRC